MIVNKHEFGNSGIDEFETLLPKKSYNKKPYHILYTNGINDDYNETTEKFLEKYFKWQELSFLTGLKNYEQY